MLLGFNLVDDDWLSIYLEDMLARDCLSIMPWHVWYSVQGIHESKKMPVKCEIGKYPKHQENAYRIQDTKIQVGTKKVRASRIYPPQAMQFEPSSFMA